MNQVKITEDGIFFFDHKLNAHETVALITDLQRALFIYAEMLGYNPLNGITE